MLHDLLIVGVNGLVFGSVYGLFAVGLVVVYRGSQVINFANGEIGMLGAFVFFELREMHQQALGLAIGIGIAFSAAFGAATYQVVMRPLRDKPRINSLVATLALDILLLFYASRRWGLQPVFTKPLLSGAGINVFGLRVQPVQLLMLGTSIALVGGLVVLYRSRSLGLRLRATAIDPSMAAQLGVNVTMTSMLTWAMGGGIAAICAILLASQVAFTVTFMTAIMVRGLTAALLGGLTNPVGAFCFGLFLGVAEGIIRYLTSAPGLVELILAAFILVFLLVRPTGLLKAEY